MQVSTAGKIQKDRNNEHELEVLRDLSILEYLVLGIGDRKSRKTKCIRAQDQAVAKIEAKIKRKSCLWWLVECAGIGKEKEIMRSGNWRSMGSRVGRLGR